MYVGPRQESGPGREEDRPQSKKRTDNRGGGKTLGPLDNAYMRTVGQRVPEDSWMTCTCTCIYVCLCVCMYACMHVCMHTDTHKHTHEIKPEASRV